MSVRAASAREARVGVERQHVASRTGGSTRSPDLHGEARPRRAAEEPVELLELPALALPAHEDAFLRVPLAARGGRGRSGRARARGGGSAPRFPARAAARISASPGIVRGRGVAEVAQDREVDVRVHVPERLHLEVLEEPLDARRRSREASGRRPSSARSRGRRPTRSRRGQPARRHERGHEALDEERPRARSPEGGRGAPRGTAASGCAQRPDVRHRRDDAERGEEADAPRATDDRVAEGEAAEPLRRRPGWNATSISRPRRPGPIRWMPDVRRPVVGARSSRRPAARSRRRAARRAPAPRPWGRRAPRRPGGSDRGSAKSIRG